MKAIQYRKLSNEKLLNRYFMAQDGNYFCRQEIPRLHKEIQRRELI